MTTTIETPVLGFAAFSGTGKTTLLTRMIPLLRKRGLRLGLIKHSHKACEIDRPGKDSYILRQAGASEVVVASARRTVLISSHPAERKADLPALLQQINAKELDLILVEGFKHNVIPKIELHRPSLGHPLLCCNDPCIIAVATDVPLPMNTTASILDLNNPVAIVDFIVNRFLGHTDHRLASSIDNTAL